VASWWLAGERRKGGGRGMKEGGREEGERREGRKITKNGILDLRPPKGF
jgi:hypothetical protein